MNSLTCRLVRNLLQLLLLWIRIAVAVFVIGTIAHLVLEHELVLSLRVLNHPVATSTAIGLWCYYTYKYVRVRLNSD